MRLFYFSLDSVCSFSSYKHLFLHRGIVFYPFISINISVNGLLIIIELIEGYWVFLQF